MKGILAALMATLLVGCADSTEPGELDGEHDDLDPGGKGDDGGPEYSLRMQVAILRVVNSVEPVELFEMGLGEKAAGGILRHRSGPDGSWLSGDDDFFESFAELDAVPYVGPNAIFALSAYAASHAYFVPDDLAIGDWTIALESDPPVEFSVSLVPHPAGYGSDSRATGGSFDGFHVNAGALKPPEFTLDAWHPEHDPFRLDGVDVDLVAATGVWRPGEGRVCGTARGTLSWSFRGNVRFVAVRPGSGVPLRFCD